MVRKATKFTPEVLLSAARRSAAVPNHDGTLALYSVSTYSFEEHTTLKEVRILDIKTGSSVQFSNDENAHDVKWLGDGTNAIIWLQSGAKGITNIMIGDGDHPSKASYTADVILAPFSNLKVKRLSDGTIACVMSGLATSSGSLYNKETDNDSHSSARVYDKLFVRYWDTYFLAERPVLWYSKFEKADGKYSLAAPVHNLLKGTNLECPFYNPLGDEGDDFDIGPTGILFNARDRNENPVKESEGLKQVYFVPLSSFTEEKAPKPKLINTGGYKGDAENPRFAPCGRKAAFLVAPDKSRHWAQRIMLIEDCTKTSQSFDLLKFSKGSPWELSASGFEWAPDGKSLLLTAEDCGRVALYYLPLTSGKGFKPERLTKDGTVSGFHALGGETKKFLVSTTSIIDNSTYSIVDSTDPDSITVVSSVSKNGSKLGLSPKQVSEIYFEGGGDYCVQAFVVKPSFFDEKKKYPLALLIHGGPEDAWRDAWSTRWNPAVWAEQGYICVAPNISGSVGFGLEFTEGILGSWGGRPYDDVIKCYEHVEKHMPYVDTTNAIAGGGSYGGYMTNWIQGNPFGRKFKALVCHDGIFNLETMIASDDFSGSADFNGRWLPWENHENLKKWNPARPDLLANWSTPQLVIHSDGDYRCPIEGGMAAFATLQASGTPSKYLNFPDENHWVLKPENSLVWHRTVFDWINKYSGVAKKREQERLLANLTLKDV